MDGKRQRTMALLQALSISFLIDFLILDNSEDFRIAQESNQSNRIRFKFLATPKTWSDRILHSLGLIYSPSSALSEQIRKFREEKDYQFAFCRYLPPMIHLPKSLPVVVDLDDDLEEIYRSRIDRTSSWIKKIRLTQVLWMNLPIYNQLLKRVTYGFTVKPEPGRPYLKLLPNLPFQLLNQGPVRFSSTTGPNILFVGKLTYPPNLNGIKWFIREVFPMILQVLPESNLTLVSNLPTDDQELNELIKKFPSLQIKIKVNDLIEIYQNHSIAIAPIFEGAGSNIKIAESLLMGRPVISTVFGTRGFEGAKGTSFLLEGSTSEEFSKQVVALFKHPKALVKAQTEAYHFGKKEFSLSRWTAQLVNDLKHVG